MRAEADLGRTAAALAQFERCRAILQSHLGVAPDAETRALAATIRARRLRGAAAAAPSFQRFADDIAVVVFRDAPEGGGRLTALARGAASDTLQAALDMLRAGPAAAAARLVAVPDTGDAARDLAHAQATLARHDGPGFVVAAEVFRRFEHWSPFTFRPGSSDPATHHLLLGEMPRHRLQVAPTVSRPAPRATIGNSLVVLPFRYHSPDAGRLNLGDVISEEIIARLARFRHQRVAGPSAGQTCRALGLSGEEIRDRLAVNYAVDGSIARIDDRLLITFSITDLKENRVVHAESFEGRFAELFAQQSVMVDRIVSKLFNRTQQAEIDRLRARMTNDLSAYELYLCGLSAHRRGGISPQNARDAVRHFDEAIGIDPDFARARAYRICASTWFEPVTPDIGLPEIDRLITLDENDPEVHRIAGSLHQMAGNFDAAVAHIDHAVALNPSDAYLLGSSAVYRAYAGDGDGALRQIGRAVEVDPFLPAWCVEDHGVVLYAVGDHAAAAAAIRRLSAPTPRALSYLAASLVAQGDVAGAARAVDRIRRMAPGFTAAEALQFATFRDRAVRDGLQAHLAQAGLT